MAQAALTLHALYGLHTQMYTEGCEKMGHGEANCLMKS